MTVVEEGVLTGEIGASEGGNGTEGITSVSEGDCGCYLLLYTLKRMPKDDSKRHSNNMLGELQKKIACTCSFQTGCC